MKKKTLVSVLAMTSASMAAYANANLDQIKTEVDQWVGAEKPSLVNGVLTSPNGTTISQSLGSLLPGTYKLSATTSMNAKFLVNGKALICYFVFVLGVPSVKIVHLFYSGVRCNG